MSEKIQKRLNDIYSKYIANQATGNFEVNINGLITCGQDIEREISRLSAMSSEIEQIRKNMQYWGTSGAYYRSKILAIDNSINYRIKDLRKLKSSLELAAQKYQAIDNKVADSFR